MIPLVGIDEATAALQGKYFVSTIKAGESLPRVEMEQPNCTICFEPPIKPVQPFVCGDHSLCHDCAMGFFQAADSRFNYDYGNGNGIFPIRVLPKCPSCRADVKARDLMREVASAACVNPIEVLQRNYSRLTFNFAPVDLDFGRGDWLTRGLLKNADFLSKKMDIPETVRGTFGLPSSCKRMAFLYPIYGKDMALAWQAVDFAQAIIKQLKSSDNQEEATLMDGLFSIGGFVFYNQAGNPVVVQALLAKPMRGSSQLTFSFDQRSEASVKQRLGKELKALRKRQASKSVSSGKDEPNIARITLGFFRDNEFATYFQCFQGPDKSTFGFGYQVGERTDSAEHYSYELVTS